MRRGMLLVVAATALAVRLAAQGPALPVMNAGVPRGFTLGSMIGFANDGGGTGLGVSGLIGLRRFGIGGFVSRISGSEFGGYQSAGGSLTAKVLGGPLVPVAVTLQAGVGYFRNHLDDASDEQSTTWHIPVGLGISWTIPRPGVALKPWIAPRVDHTRQTVDPGAGAPSVSSGTSDFGLSGGIIFGLANGVGIDLAMDRVFAAGVTPKPTVVGVGLHYTFR